MARLIEKMPDKHRLVRSVKLRIGTENNSNQVLIYPITKLVLLVRNEDGTMRFEESQKKVPK